MFRRCTGLGAFTQPVPCAQHPSRICLHPPRVSLRCPPPVLAFAGDRSGKQLVPRHSECGTGYSSTSVRAAESAQLAVQGQLQVYRAAFYRVRVHLVIGPYSVVLRKSSCDVMTCAVGFNSLHSSDRVCFDEASSVSLYVCTKTSTCRPISCNGPMTLPSIDGSVNFKERVRPKKSNATRGTSGGSNLRLPLVTEMVSASGIPGSWFLWRSLMLVKKMTVKQKRSRPAKMSFHRGVLDRPRVLGPGKLLFGITADREPCRSTVSLQITTVGLTISANWHNLDIVANGDVSSADTSMWATFRCSCQRG